MSEEKEDTSKLFAVLKKNQPRVGDVLTTANDKWIRLSVKTREEDGKTKMAMSCRCAIDIDKGGWYLTSKEIGIVCLILPQAQDMVIVTDDSRFYVRELKIVRYTENEKAMLCEVID